MQRANTLGAMARIATFRDLDGSWNQLSQPLSITEALTWGANLGR